MRLNLEPRALTVGVRQVRSGEIHGAVDQSDVRKRLRKVARLPTAPRVIPFGEQSHIVPNGQESLEEALRFKSAILQNQVVNQPEAA
jgi:hypothetical protein